MWKNLDNLEHEHQWVAESIWVAIFLFLSVIIALFAVKGERFSPCRQPVPACLFQA